MAKANGLTVPRTTCINDMQDVEYIYFPCNNKTLVSGTWGADRI